MSLTVRRAVILAVLGALVVPSASAAHKTGTKRSATARNTPVKVGDTDYTVVSRPNELLGGCDPFQASLRQELFPDSPVEIPFYLLITTSGCDVAPGKVFCLAKVTLPADAGQTTPPQALQNKCQLITAKVQTSCPRFVLSNIDCDTSNGQNTQFTITDSVCSGHVAAAGGGLALATANENTALSQSGGTGVPILLPDYELDTVLAGCPEQAGNILVISGEGSGQPIVPGGSGSFQAFLTTVNGTVTQAEPTQGVHADTMATTLAGDMNDTLIAIGDPVRCSSSGRIISCNGPLPLLGGVPTPSLTAASNDVTLQRAAAGGAENGVAAMQHAIQVGGCEDLETNCGVLGQNVTSPPEVPDGKLGSQPMRATRVSGSQIQVTWDTQCAPYHTKILYGMLNQVASYTTSGSVCNISDPQLWAPVPIGNLWFVLVSDNEQNVEGSWGTGSAGERHGLVASGLCGDTSKNIANHCP